MVLGGIALFLLIRTYGETLTAPDPPLPGSAIGTAAGSAPNAVLHVLLALVAVIVLGRLLGAALQWAGQPPVIGEVLAGIILGPSLLGRIAPTVSTFILPASVAPFLNVVAQLGIILYMFLVGVELNADLVRSRAHAAVATSHASIVAPFVLGSALALFLYPHLSPATVPSFACSWQRCRLRHFPSWRASSRIEASARPSSAPWRSHAPPPTM